MEFHGFVPWRFEGEKIPEALGHGDTSIRRCVLERELISVSGQSAPLLASQEENWCKARSERLQ
jgi:hypothetical protein